MKKLNSITFNGHKIPVTVTKGNFLYSASNKEYGVFGAGNTPEDALKLFKKNLEHCYEYYIKIPDKGCVGEGRRMKTSYEKLR